MHATGKADQDDDQVGDGTGSSCLRSPIGPWPHVREYRLGRKELTYWGVLTGRCMDLVTGMVVTAGGAQVRQGSRHELVLGRLKPVPHRQRLPLMLVIVACVSCQAALEGRLR
jgi:hypothetical protein